MEVASCIACGEAVRRAGRAKGYGLVRCPNCGLRRIDPIPDAAALAAYYSEGYSLAADSGRVDVGAYRAQARSLAHLFARLSPNARHLCEVGCSGGWVLDELRRRGYAVKGYEVSAATARIAREQHGLDVVTGEFTAEGERFDIILMRHVLEHTTDPLAQIRAASARLEPGGTLVLAVPNEGGISSRLLGQYWSWYIPPAHIWYFTEASLRALTARHGLTLRWSETRQGDANNPGVELAIGLARRLRAGTRTAVLPRAAGGEVLAKQRPAAAVTRAANVMLHPVSAIVSAAGLGDELWIAAAKESA